MPKKASAPKPALPVAPKAVRELAAGAHEAVYDEINGSLLELTEALLDRARGLWVLIETPEGEQRVYKREPDLEAIRYAMDRGMGRPVQTQNTLNVKANVSYEDLIKARRRELEGTEGAKEVVLSLPPVQPRTEERQERPSVSEPSVQDLRRRLLGS
jgi:hypothetical protein